MRGERAALTARTLDDYNKLLRHEQRRKRDGVHDGTIWWQHARTVRTPGVRKRCANPSRWPRHMMEHTWADCEDGEHDNERGVDLCAEEVVSRQYSAQAECAQGKDCGALGSRARRCVKRQPRRTSWAQRRSAAARCAPPLCSKHAALASVGCGAPAALGRAVHEHSAAPCKWAAASARVHASGAARTGSSSAPRRAAHARDDKRVGELRRRALYAASRQQRPVRARHERQQQQRSRHAGHPRPRAAWGAGVGDDATTGADLASSSKGGLRTAPRRATLRQQASCCRGARLEQLSKPPRARWSSGREEWCLVRLVRGLASRQLQLQPAAAALHTDLDTSAPLPCGGSAAAIQRAAASCAPPPPTSGVNLRSGGVRCCTRCTHSVPHRHGSFDALRASRPRGAKSNTFCAVLKIFALQAP